MTQTPVIPTTIKEKPKMRNSSLELLRIVAMILIIAHHYSVHGGLQFDNTPSFNRFWVQCLQLGGKLGVNIFVLISGYFLSKQTTYRWSKIFKFILEVTVYSIAFYLLSVILGPQTFSIRELARHSIPLVFSSWWFASTYFVFLLICPLLSRVSEKLNQKLHIKIIILFTVLWCIVPTLTTSPMESNNLLWFIYLFFCVAYIRKYPNKFTQKIKYPAIVGAASLSFIVLIIFVYDILGEKFPIFSAYATFYEGQQILPLVALSFSMFLIFLNIPAFQSKIINILAAAMFGVYLIHDSNFTRSHIWHDLLKTPIHVADAGLFVHSLVSILLVFIISTLISLCFNLILGKLLSKVSLNLDNVFSRAYSYIDSKLPK